MTRRLADDRTPARLHGDATGPGMIVAEGLASSPPGLGLSSPLAWRGGGGEALDRLALDLGFGWQRELRSVVDEAIVQAGDERSPWFRLPPLLLTGDGRVGRLHAARRIAFTAGLPHVHLDFEDGDAAERLRSGPYGPDLILPSLPVLAMTVGGCANPVVSVGGVETLDPATQLQFAEMIDPASAIRWLDYAVGATVDLRHVNWMIGCVDPSAVTPTLLRLTRRVRMSWPEPYELPLHVTEVLAEAAIGAGLIDRVQQRAGDALTHLCRAGRRRSTADIYDAARLWLAAHCQ